MNIEKNRHLIILDRLTKASKPVTAEQLADLSRSSIRTIKSDVNLLREQLEKEEIATIDSFKAKGYMINPIHEWTYTKFLMNLEAMMRVFYNRSIEETNRRMYIVQRILAEEELKIDDICDALFISRSAISRDIEWATAFLNSYDLSVQHVPGRGLVLSGNELHIRKAMTEVHCSQYHDFQQLYPYEPFNHLFYDDRQVYEDVRHAFLAILRNTCISIDDLAAKKIPTYMCLANNRIRQGRLIKLDESIINEITSTYDYQVAKQILSDPIIKSLLDFPEVEAINLARLILISRDIDMRSKGLCEIPLAYVMENDRIYKKIKKKALNRIGKSLLKAEFFRFFETDIKSVQLELYLRHRFDSTKEKTMINYIESDETLLSPIPIQMARIMIGYLQEEFNEEINDPTITSYAALFERILKKVTYPYKKRRIMVTATEGLVYGQHMKENLLRSYGKYIDNIDVYNLYEMRKVNFNDYDAMLHSGHLIYYVYPLKSVIFNELDYQNNQNALFSELFKDGYDRTRITEIKKILNIYQNVRIDSIDMFMENLAFRYGNTDDDSNQIIRDYYDNRKIFDYYSNRQNSLLCLMRYEYTKKEFIHIFIPENTATYHETLDVKYIIVASINPDNSVSSIKIDNHVLQYLTQVNDAVYRLVEDKDTVLEEMFDRIVERNFFDY